MNKDKPLQNINNALNNYLWILFKSRHNSDDTLMNPLYAYILIHLYISGSWSFVTDQKLAYCNNLKKLGLVEDADYGTGSYKLSHFGRQCVEDLIPHYYLVFWFMWLGIVLIKLPCIFILGIVTYRAMILIRPCNCSIGLHHASLGEFVKMLDSHTRKLKPCRQDIRTIEAGMFPKYDQKPLLALQYRLKVLILGA